MSLGYRRPGGNWSVTRPDKLYDYQTVLYEIDMLRFAYSRLLKPLDNAKNADIWVNLESFLVHYRNLLDFLGKPPREDSDLSISRPEVIWDRNLGLDSRLPGPDTLDRMRTVGRTLWEKYEGRSQRDDTISRCLQHCTTFRTTFKSWFPVGMMAEIREILELLEKHLPEFKPASNSYPVDRNHFLGGTSVSTQSESSPTHLLIPDTPTPVKSPNRQKEG